MTVLGLAVIAAAAWWVTRSSVFDARSVSVEGNSHLTRGDVLRLGGVGPHTNLVWFSPGAVEERLERSPWIVSARVSRALPSALSISVRERRAVAIVKGPRPYVVAADGTILGGGGGRANLPEIDAPAASLRVGGRLPDPAPGLVAVQAMSRWLRARVEHSGLDRNGALVLTLRSGARVFYGDATEASSKGNATAALLEWATREGVTPSTLDVRSPGRPAMRLVA